MKKIFSFLLVFIIILNLFITVKAENIKFDYKMDLPTTIQYNRTISVDVMINTHNLNLAAAVFIIEFDSEIINFKDIKFTNKSDNCNIKYNELDDKVITAFLDMKCIKSNKYVSAFKFEFTPKVETDKTKISIYFEQAANIEEQFLKFNNGIDYDIAISKNKTSNTLSKGAMFSDEKQDKIINEEKQEHNKLEQDSNNDTTENEDIKNGNIIIQDSNNRENNNVQVFILGFIACCMMIIMIFTILRYFKKSKENVTKINKNNSTENDIKDDN